MSSAAVRAARPVLARNMSAITAVNGRYIIDSRGNPTVEVGGCEVCMRRLRERFIERTAVCKSRLLLCQGQALAAKLNDTQPSSHALYLACDGLSPFLAVGDALLRLVWCCAHTARGSKQQSMPFAGQGSSDNFRTAPRLHDTAWSPFSTRLLFSPVGVECTAVAAGAAAVHQKADGGCFCCKKSTAWAKSAARGCLCRQTASYTH